MEVREESEKYGNRDDRTLGAGPTYPKKKPLNFRRMLGEFNQVLRVQYRDSLIPAGCTLILAIIHDQNTETGKLCPREVINSKFGIVSRSGKYVSKLEENGLIKRHGRSGYNVTIDGELLLRNIVTDLTRILEDKPTKRMRKQQAAQATGTSSQPWTKYNIKGLYVKRPMAPIETFNALVEEVLSKPGLNQKVKYALLRTLGMHHTQAKAAIKQLAPLKNTERIKPILKGLLSQIP